MSTSVDVAATPVPIDAPQTLPAQLLAHVDARAGDVALRVKELGLWREITWAEYTSRAASMGLGLRALGIGAGDHVAILSDNRPEWLFVDLGVQGIGAVSVGVYPTGSEDDVMYVLRDSGTKVAFVENEEQFDKIMAVRAHTPDLQKIAVIDPHGIKSLADPMTMSLEEVEVLGEQRAREAPTEWRESVEALRGGDDIAIVVYTSGVAGPPQGVMLSHRSLLAAAAIMTQFFGARRDDEVLSYLPLCHVAERLVSVVAAVYTGYVVNFGEGGASFPNDLREVQPTFFLGVPRVWERLLASVELRIANAGPIKRWNYKTWSRRGARAAIAMRSGKRRHSGLVGSLLLYRSVRKKLGLSRVRVALSGAAPIAASVLEFFWALGIPVREIYGQTEDTALATAMPEHDVRFGTVGLPLPGVQVRVADDGEVVVRSPGNFSGYLRDEMSTRTSFDENGWLKTGDLGAFDPDGFLTITGRRRDLIITAGGLNVSPARLENLLKASPFIREAMVIGDRRPHLAALLGIEFEAVAEWANEQDLTFATYQDLSESAEVRRLVDGIVSDVNRQVAESEQIRAFELFPVPLEDADALTATQKVRRERVIEQFAPLVENMYAA